MVTSRRMTAIDRNAAALGVPTRALMEAAGGAVAEAVAAVADDGDRVTVVCGRENNGGDGFVAARYLEAFALSLRLVGDPAGLSGAAADNWDALTASAFPLTTVRDSTELEAISADVVVDALLGTGLDGPIREPVRTAIETINDADATVVSVDVPSGIDPDTGVADGLAVEADRVVTFHAMAPGLVDLACPVEVADIGIPSAAEVFVGPGDRAVLEARHADAHKGDHGRVLVVGGGPYTGAPALCGLGALRAGADLVEVATPSTAAEAAANRSPDLLVTDLPGDRLTPAHLDRLEPSIEKANVLVVGPGLGDHSDTREAAAALIEANLESIVVDADGLGALEVAAPSAEVIATPHAGEFEALGFTSPTDWRARESVVAEAARELGVTVLLKGRYDVISNGARTAVNRTGNPGMTVGGTGDVLAGVTAALTQRGTSIEASSVAAWVTGRAGDICLDEIGIGYLASDVIEAIPAATGPEQG